MDLHCKVLRKIVLDGRNDSLDEFQENNQVHMDAQLTTAFLHGLDDLLHDFRVPGMRMSSDWLMELTESYIERQLLARMNGRHIGTRKMWMRLHRDGLFRVILADILVHLLDGQWFAVLWSNEKKNGWLLNPG